MRFRKSESRDVDACVAIAKDAKALLKSRGVSQWQAGPYPDRPTFESDVDKEIGYVVEDDLEVIAVCAVTFSPEACYETLESGCWLTPSNEGYATIHRSAVALKSQGKHVAGYLFDRVCEMAKENGCKSVRVDTHPDNKAMQKALENAGFVRCGVLVLVSGQESGDKRIGYEKLV